MTNPSPTASDEARSAAINRLNIHARVIDYPGGEIGMRRDAMLAFAAQPVSPPIEVLAELKPLVDAAAGPNGWDWMLPLRVVPVDGKPTIVSHKGGNLFRGYIGTWREADLLVALANAAPRILAALAERSTRVDGDREAVQGLVVEVHNSMLHRALADVQWTIDRWEEAMAPTLEDPALVQRIANLLEALTVKIAENLPEKGHLETVLTHPAESVVAVDREVVARIIDPDTYAAVEGYSIISRQGFIAREKWKGVLAKADAILALAHPAESANCPVGGEALREAVEREIALLRRADSPWAIGIRNRLKQALALPPAGAGDVGYARGVEELESALCAPSWSDSLGHVHNAIRALSARKDAQ